MTRKKVLFSDGTVRDGSQSLCVSVFDAMHDERMPGLDHDITSVEALEVVEDRLTRMAELEGFPIGKPQEYDQGVHSHQIPGGVISNLKSQLTRLGIGDKLGEVLDEVVRIIGDMGQPIMITPASQFIVSQAAVDVATGGRYTAAWSHRCLGRGIHPLPHHERWCGNQDDPATQYVSHPQLRNGNSFLEYRRSGPVVSSADHRRSHAK